ncbi:MAG: gliding motility-associated C-terminal domain-containing protein [Bacteroidota bacterium]
MKTLLLPILFLCSPFLIHTQSSTCEGNLGDNIFQNGDFGAGTVNVPEKPGEIISAYVYVWQAPPPAGYYLLTNNTGDWDFLYPSWLAMGDKSDDPDGYFMVVNGDNFPGLFYEQVIENLCGNTEYTFSVDIINIIKANISNQKMPNISFLLNDERVMGTGNIQQNERWNTYEFSFTTQPNETSVRISLKNNVVEGEGNDFALDNFSLRTCGPKAEIQPRDTTHICRGELPVELHANLIDVSENNWLFQWQKGLDNYRNWEDINEASLSAYEHQETQDGIYHYRYLIAKSLENLTNPNCRINSDIATIQMNPMEYFIEEVICEGSSYQLGNQTYENTGIYTANLTSSIGCDSIVTLDLTVAKSSGIDASVEMQSPSCANGKDGRIEILELINASDAYTIYLNGERLENEETLNSLSAGTYHFIIKDSLGCQFEQTFQLTDPKDFRLDIDDRLEVNLGEEVTILPIVNQSVQQFFWQGCDNCSSGLSLRPIQSQLYTLTAISETGCVATDSVFIQVNSIGKLFIPSAFSPNNDGINDYFSIFASQSSVAEILQFMIFDRWGNIVFERHNLAATDGRNIWDGYVNGKRIVNGTYTCVTRIRLLDGKEELVTQQLTVVD